ncbi:sugar porter family MFS transporter [Dictyobacter kobayashii]|uniref:MFS transporter n=1 Tax=Dictyobacter kobayashii TaxID=2014872 RepID=A0A402AX47_9CHLR|nr:sugar porter family MFS transporter [Dictyobacter kobayashii]GCE23668.1 MFS transporter [Dictyobacter kobayashii]
MNTRNGSGRDEDEAFRFGPQLMNNDPSISRSQSRWGQHVLLYVVAMVAALGGLLFGYDTAVISGAMLFLRVSFALNAWMQEITVSIALLGAAIGALSGGKLSDMLGRRTTLRITAGVFTLGTLCTALSVNWMMFLGLRLIVGLSIGATASIVPVYISEIAPFRLRGVLVTFNQLALTIGIAAAYWVDLAFASAHMGWPPMYAVTAIPGLALLIGMLFTLESPRWLASKGRWSESALVLGRLCTFEEATQEWQTMRTSFAGHSNHGSLHELLRPGIRVALLVGVSLAIFQQVVGINTVIYYAPTIFEYAGFTSASSAILATSIVGVVNVLTTIVAGILIDRVGRRALLIGGTIGMATTLLALGLIFAIGPRQSGYLILTVLLGYVIAFAVSLGPVFWVLCAEIFPTHLRATGASIATFANWSANLLVSLTFLSLINLIGKSFTFWLYALMSLLALAFCILFVPETRNKSLEQIEAYWVNGRRWEKKEKASSPAESIASIKARM